MGKILPDREVRKLIGTVLLDADPDRLNPNGIEFRVGPEVMFHSTDEIKDLREGTFLVIRPSESVIICSLESIDFTRETVEKHFPGHLLMAWITPTTTMMREGVVQSATKIDAGFNGSLNWGLRNQSMSDLVIGYGESIFKLTFYLLDEDEAPDIAYGERGDDGYQGSKGVAVSTRKVPSHIPDRDRVTSGRTPEDELARADGPIGAIGKQLSEVHGEFKIVHNTINAVKEDFDRTATMLSDKIDAETSRLSEKIDGETNRLSTQMKGEGKLHRDWVHGEFRKQLIQMVGLMFAAAGVVAIGLRAFDILRLTNVQQVWFILVVVLLVVAATVYVGRDGPGPRHE